jgi:hypothetical protein
VGMDEVSEESREKLTETQAGRARNYVEEKMIKYPLIDDTACSREDDICDGTSDRKKVKTHKIGFPMPHYHRRSKFKKNINYFKYLAFAAVVGFIILRLV